MPDETSRSAHLDCGWGVSGAMLLGALVDAGASVDAVRSAVDTLGVGAVRLTVGRVDRRGTDALRLRIRAPRETPEVRSWEDVDRILEFAALPEPVRSCTRRVLGRLAEAEATAPHQLHAVQALTDAVAVCAALTDLRVGELTTGAVGVGAGTVETALGALPLPTPPVRRLLAGRPTLERPDAGELVTPLGAAVVAELAAPVDAAPRLVDVTVGVGAGPRDTAGAPVLRVAVGDRPDRGGGDGTIGADVRTAHGGRR